MEHTMGKDTCLNIIFDGRQPEDKERLIKEFGEQGITNYKFWDAIVLKDSVVKSINLSHKMVVKYAKDNNHTECCLMEQDIYFTSPNAWRFFLDNKPESFSLYLWGSYIVPLSNHKICGFQLYVIHSSFYDAFLSTPDDVHIDTYMDELKGDYKFCYPFPALQRAGFSSNNMAVVDYNKILSEQDIYKG